MQVFQIAVIAGAAAASTFAAVLWVLSSRLRRPEEKAEAPHDVQDSVSLLFERGRLQHCSDAAARRFDLAPGRDDWVTVRDRLATRFPKLPQVHSDAAAGETVIEAHDIEDRAALLMRRDGDHVSLGIAEDGVHHRNLSDRIDLLQLERDALKRACDTSSQASWQVDAAGRVTWYNAAYETLYRRLHDDDPETGEPVFRNLGEMEDKRSRQRVPARAAGSSTDDWYDVSAVDLGDITVFHAMNVNAVVKSEVAQRNFVQTLAKTFAHLSIGLAIFDRNGQLALFNPALIDLTNLPADFLSGRPTLISFFDRIRENRRMPEPKDYRSWRQQIAEVIAAATDGRYQETWTLETGQTYRVNGRPHPDGAIAFLIEDISAEISLTRNFRAELEMGQSLMDSFDEALVVFSPTGVLTFCNRAYRDGWGVDPGNSFADVTIQNCIDILKERCEPGADWDALREFVLDFGERTPWTMEARLKDGSRFDCKVSRIASGATLLRCRKIGPALALVEDTAPQAARS